MKFLIKKAAILLLLLHFISVLSQSGRDIIDKNIQLSGGLTNWKLLNSVLLQGNVTLGLTNEYPIKIYQARPNLTKTSITVNGQEQTIEGFDGKNGYSMDYRTNKMGIDKSYVADSFDNDFIDFENKGFKAEFLGKEKIGNLNCLKVQLTKNVNKTIYYFDDRSYMLVREIKKDEVLDYSNYKKVGNLLFPYRIESSSQSKNSDFVMIIQKIELNRNFPANTFKF